MEVEQRCNNYKLEEKPINDEILIELDKSIKQIIEGEGFTKYKIVKKCISTNGGNYLAMLFEIDVTGSTKDGDKETNIFVKQAIDIEAFQIVSISQVYTSELFVYKDLSKIFHSLQEKANVPLEERFKMVKIYDESNTGAIIMENLTRKGYTTYHRMDPLPLQFIQKSVENLARFHGLSFVLKVREPEYFEEKIKPLKHPMVGNSDLEELVRQSKVVIMSRIDDDVKEKVEKIYKDIVKKFYESCNIENIKVCLCHGDYRPNNILVKINEDDVEDVITVDYQIIHYGSPVIDFLFFVYLSTDREIRKTHLLTLKDLYYNTFSNFLKYFDLDADVVYSKKEFDNVYKEHHECGPRFGILSIPFVFACENHTLDMSKDKGGVAFQLDDRFKDRLRGYVEDFEELGYI